MEGNVDELEKNKFFQTLQRRYKRKYDLAQKRCWVICVPSNASLDGIHMTHEFYDYHILKPSPFFKGQYVSTGNHQSHSFEILEKEIKTFSGAVKILMEEICYNEDYKPYRILVIEHPLNRPQMKMDLPNDSSHSNTNLSQPSDCLKLIKSFPDQMKLLDKRITQFSLSYVFLPDYLHDATVKLQEMLKWAEKIFVESQKLSYISDSDFISELRTSLESYILSNMYNKLFPVIRRKFFEEDKTITEKLFFLYENNLTPDQLGVNESFCCHTPSAVVELASLNLKNSPLKKLFCLLATLEYLNKDIAKAVEENVFLGNTHTDVPYITSDDLIPLLINVMVQARPLYLASNLYFIQNYCWHLSAKDKLGFTLVTFQAAKECLKEIEFSSLSPSKCSIKKQVSLDELMSVTVKMHSTDNKPLEKKPAHKPSVIDCQLENVTKMIEASTLELEKLSHSKIDYLAKRHSKLRENSLRKDEMMGGFLSDLQHTSLGFSFGKKS